MSDVTNPLDEIEALYFDSLGRLEEALGEPDEAVHRATAESCLQMLRDYGREPGGTASRQ